MKFFAVLLTFSLITVACNKKEEAAAPEAGVTEVAPSSAAMESHDKEHHHVTEGADHAHEDAHHGDHDHAAHHPNHDAEVGSDTHSN
ncbi:MAG: hypothetical protein ACLGG0_01645 [Bacteriovoracia bacterium]